MRRSLWKRAVGLVLASVLAFTGMPAAGLAAEASGETNIAGQCAITVPSVQHPAENMTDGDTSTLWVNNGATWPCTAEFALPAANTKCVKRVVLKFEQGHTPWSVEVSLKYALNGVTSDLVTVEGSRKQVNFDDGYAYEFTVPQAMSHLYVTLDNPLNNGAAGGFWPAIAEVEIYIDNEAEEEIVLKNLAEKVSLDASVDTEENRGKITDGDDATAAPLYRKTLGAMDPGEEAYVETSFRVNQKIRKITLAMAQDDTGARYSYTLYGKMKGIQAYEKLTEGTVGTGAADRKAEILASEIEEDVKEISCESVKAVFQAANEAAKNTIPKLADFQVLANQASIVEADTENIAWETKDIHANYNQDTVGRIVDGNTKNTWTAKQYPAYVDIGLDGEYSLDEVEVYTPSAGYSQYSIYYSSDGQNYAKLAEKTGRESCPETGEVYDAGQVKASSVRILLEYHSENEKAVLNEVRIKGKRVGDRKEAAFIPPVSYTESDYDTAVTAEDTIQEVQGIVSRNLGEAYRDWFDFVLGQEAEFDYFELEDGANGKIRITGNDGVSLATGLNHYLKYYCGASITQVGNQVKMPKSPVAVGTKVHKECKVPVRYAYNYCTMSYSMAFWGEDEWRKELDWLALNGVNLVLDVTGQEEVWRQFLETLGYSHQQVKDYIAGPAYYAWAYMANLSGYGGPVHDNWFADRTELARKNQLIMRKLGMQPALQGYSGMVPTDVAQVASGEYALNTSDVIAQGLWCAFQRPYMLRTTSDAYKKYAALFYECQKNVYGDVTDYYATDPFHEGGNTGGMNTADVSRYTLKAMMDYDPNAVWVIQSWQGNPTNGLLSGLEGNRDHALILDLYAEKTPHWNETNPNAYGGGNFANTPFVYCMLNNFGGRMGLHGHMDNLVEGVIQAANTSPVMSGVGITPEGSQNNPVLYDLLFEMVWCDDASKPLEKIDTSWWLREYAKRRYGGESENAYQAMLILENTVYKASLNMLGQGAPESYVNARPSTSIGAASTWGNAVISYDMADLEKAAGLLLKEYDKFKESDGYLYDVADILKQVLSNTAQVYHGTMVSALEAGDLDAFTKASDKFLALIDKVEKVLGTRKEFLLGTWVGMAERMADGTDDFTKDLYEFNAKSLVTTWGGYPQCETGGLKDYSNRQWAGLTKDYYKQRWSMWIDQKKAELAGESAGRINWFEFEWAWARANTEYTTEASGEDLKALGLDILKNYSAGGAASGDADDYPAENTRLKEAGSEETSSEDGSAANVLDGDRGTIWHTRYSGGNDKESYDNHYLVFELKEETEIAGLRYLPRQDTSSNGTVTGYQIYVSTDGTDYTLAAEGRWSSDRTWKLASFAEAKRAKYVKFVVTSSVCNNGIFSSAAEIRLTVPPRLVTDIQLTADKTELKVGETLQLHAKVLPEDASDGSVSWISENQGIAFVDEDGLVTAKAEGSVTIRAEARDESGVSGQITLRVIKDRTKEEAAAEALREQLGRSSSGKKEADYTEASWKAYRAALDRAEKVLANPEASLEDILSAGEAVKKAEAALQKKPVDNGTPVPEKPLPKVGSPYKTSALWYKVTASSTSKKTVAVQKPVKKASRIVIPDTITIEGYVYKVTEIAPKAFRKNVKVSQVVIGKNVTKIGKQAFDGCKKLKKATVKAVKLKTIGKWAFRGIYKKAMITVPKKKYKAYAKLIKKAKTAGSVKILKK